MNLFAVELWALWCAFGLMLVAAVVNARTLRVPNLLSMPATVAGWLTALLMSCSLGIPSEGGGIVASFVATAVALVLLIPFYATGWLGAGCVKTQMAFGAWVGCALAPIPAALLTGLGTLAGGALSAVGALVYSRASQSREAEDPRSHLFPAQVTLSLGSIVGAVVPLVAGWL
jgi:Flp pilus assembly protein protease CpaA